MKRQLQLSNAAHNQLELSNPKFIAQKPQAYLRTKQPLKRNELFLRTLITGSTF
jgi:hypothetical protein